MVSEKLDARSRGLFSRFASVPTEGQEAPAFLQRRLRTYLTIVLSLWTAAFVIEQFASLFLDGHLINFRGPRADAGLYLATYVAVVALQIAMLLVVRTRALAPAANRGIELVVTLAMISHACLMLAGRPLATRPDMLMLYAATIFLMLRAATMPETSRSAAVSGAVVMALVLGGTAFVHLRAPGKSAALAVQEIVSQAVLAAVSVGLTTAITFVIYGLRERVRAAMELGQYTLIEKIGEGGMGVVYRARHALLRRPTAVKILASKKVAAAASARFEREVQLTADLSHANIVSVYDFGRSPQGEFYYAMEYLDGIDLQRLVDDDGPQPVARVVHLLIQAADALAEAHEVGLIHRDVKPANLMLTNHGRHHDQVKVLDFGLAKVHGEDQALNEGDAGAVLGTPLYMSPEAVLEPGEVDAQSDVYALGAVGYFLLSGATPFTGRSLVELFARQVSQEPEPPSKQRGSSIPDALERLVLACLAKAKTGRPASAGALVDALRGLDVEAWPAEAARAWWQARASRVAPASPELAPALTQTLLVAPRSAG